MPSFFGGKPTSVDEEVLDMVGELANMIGGNAKERMTLNEVNLGLPTVICGKGHRVSFDPGAQVELLPFSCVHGLSHAFTVSLPLKSVSVILEAIKLWFPAMLAPIRLTSE
jgi:CheY-specific phosphatase CheX